MSIWETVAKLAQSLLGETANAPRDLSKINARIVPERGRRHAKTFTSSFVPAADIEVLPEYEFIRQALLAGCPSIFVTGKAGTGKSTLVHWLSQQLESCAIVAPTAIAALQVGGDTIHSFFGLPASHLDPDEAYRPSARNRLVIENLKYLIVDEVSMVLPNMVDVISNTLKSVRRSDRPFGGVPTIFVGDLFQLPPVVSTQEETVYFSHRYRTRFFFSADVFREQDIMPVHLTEVRRQVDAEFVDALNRIRMNDDCRESVALLNRRCYRDKENAEHQGVHLVTTNQAARTINTRELDKISGGMKTYEASVTGDLPANKWKSPAPDRLELKIGAKIMFLKNKKPSWINGDLGTVVGMEDDHIRVRKDDSDNVLLVGKESWQKCKYTYDYEKKKIEREVVGTFEQIPVTLGWAITIHKSQGLTLDRLVLDLGGGAFCEGQTYVGLSRAKTIEGVTLAMPISMRDVRVDPLVLEFYRNLGFDP